MDRGNYRRRRLHGLVMKLSLLVAVVAGVALLYVWSRSRPEDLPWTELDLARPIGAFTGRKLTALANDAPRCRVLLGRAGVRATALPTTRSGGQCGYEDGTILLPGGAREIGYSPARVATSCAVAASLALWEWEVVQPAALARLGSPVVAIQHYGSYSCRRLYGRSGGGWSEHATANAIDIAGFVLEDGTRVSVLRDWGRSGSKAAFLREVRDGACRLFATALSPDYNAAHRDHLHFDQADRGATGWRACR